MNLLSPFKPGERVTYNNGKWHGTVRKAERDAYGWDVNVRADDGTLFWIGADRLAHEAGEEV